jgi:hypothetical protein
VPPVTESEVLTLLRLRHCKPGNSGAGEYAFMTSVRNSAGFSSTRTFDAVALSLWPSRGLTLHAYEVKCSRGDWLRELKDPAKAEAAAKLCDRFSVVASDDKIVAEGELPLSWGLLVVRRGKLVCVRDAPLLPEARPKAPIPREFVVALLRAGGAVPSAEADEVVAARREGREQGRAEGDARADDMQAALLEARRVIQRFEQAAGVSLTGWRGENPETVGRAVRTALAGEGAMDAALDTVRRAQTILRNAAAELDRHLPAESVMRP